MNYTTINGTNSEITNNGNRIEYHLVNAQYFNDKYVNVQIANLSFDGQVDGLVQMCVDAIDNQFNPTDSTICKEFEACQAPYNIHRSDVWFKINPNHNTWIISFSNGSGQPVKLRPGYIIELIFKDSL